MQLCAACLSSILTGHSRSLLSALAVPVVSSSNGACRLREAPPDDLAVLHSRSCARKTPPPTVHPRILERIVEMRESPPEHLQRVPGPKALLSYLPRDAELQADGALLCLAPPERVFKILRQQGCILEEPTRRRQKLSPREPLEEVQMDGYLMPAPSLPMRKASSNTWWRFSTADRRWNLYPAQRPGASGLSCAIWPSRLLYNFCGSMACLPC